MSSTRIKITLGEATIEIEGSESFVDRHWEELKSYMTNSQTKPVKHQLNTLDKSKKVKRNEIAEKKGLSYLPIPINLTGGEGVPSLKEFYEEKKPETNEELVTFFAFYLREYCGVDEMQMGHAVSCYNAIEKRKPNSIYDICKNSKRKWGYLDKGEIPYSFKLNIQGENLVKHDLPKKSDK